MAKKVRFCTDEERWKTSDCYAVKKKGTPKAIAATTLIDGERVPIPTKEIATEIMNSKKNAEELSVEFRLAQVVVETLALSLSAFHCKY